MVLFTDYANSFLFKANNNNYAKNGKSKKK